jgi:prepilin-type N-terminal cleavage/methylation domain-containing protein
MRRAAARRRSGFTLTELMIVVVLIGLIGTALSVLLMRQQRFHRAVVSITDSRARMRDIATILPTDLRSVSSAGSDILAFDETSVQFRAFVGTSVACDYPNAASDSLIGLPPVRMASGTILSAWINPPAPGDIAYVYSDGTDVGNADDDWTRFTIVDTLPSTNASWCPSTNVPPFTTAADNGEKRYRLRLSAKPSATAHKAGAVIRFAREVKYSAYEATDGQWYVGYQVCTPDASPTTAGTCGTRELLAGPILPATSDTLTSGFFLVFYNQTGTRITDVALKAQIARVSIGIRATSESLRQASATGRSTIAGGDSLRIVVGIRNRI